MFNFFKKKIDKQTTKKYFDINYGIKEISYEELIKLYKNEDIVRIVTKVIDNKICLLIDKFRTIDDINEIKINRNVVNALYDI
jgi:hypothetical protein